jgi:Transmembrane secretion effector
MALVHVTAVIAVALAVGGVCWILALSTLASLYQLTLPRWIKARGMSFYLIVFQGGNAVGSAALGFTAQHVGLAPVLLAAAAGLALGPLAGLRWRFRQIPPEQLVPAADWPGPQVSGDETPSAGPVLVTIEYLAQKGRADELLGLLRDARFARRRTGATRWRAWREVSQPERILEEFIVGSWDEVLRAQDRVSKHDQQRFERIRELTDPGQPPTVTHWLGSEGRPASR